MRDSTGDAYFPHLLPSPARTNGRINMEEIKKEEQIEDTGTDETSHEDQTEETVTEEKSEETESKETDIDYKKELDNLESGQKPRSEIEKAERALHFNAERLKQLGGDPAKVLKFKVEDGSDGAETPDVSDTIQREFATRDVRALSRGNEDMFKLMMWYVDNRKCTPDEAYILANKGRLQRSIIEANRGKVEFGKPDGGGKKIVTEKVPTRSPEEVALLERRGYKFNPKTNTYQANIYEEYFDATDNLWKSRKIAK